MTYWDQARNRIFTSTKCEGTEIFPEKQHSPGAYVQGFKEELKASGIPRTYSSQNPLVFNIARVLILICCKEAVTSS